MWRRCRTRQALCGVAWPAGQTSTLSTLGGTRPSTGPRCGTPCQRSRSCWTTGRASMRVRTTAAAVGRGGAGAGLTGEGAVAGSPRFRRGRRTTPARAPTPVRMRPRRRCIETGSPGGCRLELAAENGGHSRPQRTTGDWPAAIPDPACATPGWRTAGGRTRNDGGGGGLTVLPRCRVPPPTRRDEDRTEVSGGPPGSPSAPARPRCLTSPSHDHYPLVS